MEKSFKHVKSFSIFESEMNNTSIEKVDEAEKMKKLTDAEVKAVIAGIAKASKGKISADSLESEVEEIESLKESEEEINEGLAELWNQMTTLKYNPSTVEYDTISGQGALGWVMAAVAAAGLTFAAVKGVKFLKDKMARKKVETNLDKEFSKYCMDNKIDPKISPFTKEGQEVIAKFVDYAKTKGIVIPE